MLKDIRNRIAAAIQNVGSDDTVSEQAEIVRLYARLADMKREVEALEKEARGRAIDLYEGYGLTVLEGYEGVVTMQQRAAPRSLDRKQVERYLTPAQLQACLKEGKPSTAVTFTAKRVP